MDNCILKRRLAQWASFTCVAMLLAGGSVGVSSCKDDTLLTGTPDWLGSSIYEELEERGSFTQTLALINDPDLSETNYPDLLRRTGSMTMFVADDAAWARFLQKRGLSSVSQLSKAEKKNLLKASMINSAYLIDLLGNKAGDPPTEGACMRHTTRVDATDSIPVLLAKDMPEQAPTRDNYVDHWADVRSKSSIYLFQDLTAPPMMYLLPKYMTQNAFTEKDIQMLMGGTSTSSDLSLRRSYVNGYPIARNEGKWGSRDTESTGVTKEFLQDITCQNGYIHIVEEVPEQLGNMAQVIASKPQFSTFHKLLERFSYPDLYAEIEENGQTYSYYTKQYFNTSLNSAFGSYTKKDGTVVTVDDKLSIDPGWNRYIIYTANNQYGMDEDAAAMFVPNNDQMDAYLSPSGDGAAIGAKFGYNWDNVPDNLVAPFINNCIQKSFRATLPSKLEAMKNTAAEPMGMTADDIKNCYLACNGVVYEVGSVFPAPEHEAVLFPALLRADEEGDMKFSNKIITYDPTALNTSNSDEAAIRNAWKLHEFKAYLNSMSSTYSFLLPADAAYAYYVDPYSFTQNQKPAAWVFNMNSKVKDPLQATSYLLDEEGNITSKKAPTAAQPKIAQVANRLYDIIDNCIIVHGQKGAETFRPSQTIYQTKTGSPVQVTFEGSKVTGVAGSMQINNGETTTIAEAFDMTDKGNGVTYIMNKLPQPTIITPDSLINDVKKYPEYTAFSRLLKSSSFYQRTNTLDGHLAIGHPISLFGNYHYTVYVPESATIDKLINDGKLPSDELIEGWESLETKLKDFDPADGQEAAYEAAQEMVKEHIDQINASIDNFVQMHVQDGSVFLGGEQISNVRFETASVDMEMSRFRTLTINNTGDAITVNVTNSSLTANVIAGENSNQMSRQYLFNSSDRTIFSSSYVVTHLIDKPLIYNDDPTDKNYQFLPFDAELGHFPTAQDKWPEDLLGKYPGDSEAKKYSKKYRR